MNTENNKKKLENSLFQWKMNKDELKKQVEEYFTLGTFKSVRKISAILLIFSAIITFVLWFFGAVSFDAWPEIIIMLILSIFVRRGSRVAIILAMIYWTIEKIFQLVGISLSVGLGGFFSIVVWWFIYMSVFWQAYQVETERKKSFEKHE